MRRNFKFRSADLGLINTGGLWNSIYLHDFNEDGRLDILAGNAGANFKWKASPEAPVKLFVGDFDENEQPETVIFNNYFGKNTSFAGLDKLKTQLPGVRKQFQSYADFSTIEKIEDLEIYKVDNEADRRELRELRSMLFLSNGEKYESIPLPNQAQWSSIQDMIITESNEIIFVGNHDGYLAEFGKSAANSGGKFAGFDSENSIFGKYTPLNLPSGANTRKIVPLDNGVYFVVVNDEKGYFLGRE